MKSLKWFLILIYSLFLLSCGADNQVRSFIQQVKNLPNTLKIDISPRNFRIIVTDAPDGYSYLSSANLTISKVEVKSKQGTYTSVLAEERNFDLVSLRNGKYITLTELDIPEGEYTDLKIFFSKATIKTTSGAEFNLTVPKGAEEGVSIPILEKVNPTGTNKEVIVLDIDLGTTFLLKGDLATVAGVTGADFFPVMRAANFNKTGYVAGKVVFAKGIPPKPTEEGIKEVKITISQGAMSTTTITETDGTFVILGLPLGDYKITTYKEGYMGLPDQSFKITELGVNTVGTGMIKLP